MRRLLATTVAALLLAGCATEPRKPAAETPPVDHRPEARRALVDWVAGGRVAILHGDESWHATLHWEQRGERYHIRLIAPLGQGSVALRGLPGAVMMEHEEGAVMAGDPETLLERHLGWRIPVTGLLHWVRGLPAPGGEPQRTDGADGLPARLLQDGWTIDFRRWGEHHGVALPEKLFMEADGLKVRLVIDRWQLPSD